MAKIINTSRLNMRLPSGHMLARESTLTVTNAELDGDNAATLASLAGSGVTVERDAEPEAPAPVAEPVQPVADPENPPAKSAKGK